MVYLALLVFVGVLHGSLRFLGVGGAWLFLGLDLASLGIAFGFPVAYFTERALDSWGEPQEEKPLVFIEAVRPPIIEVIRVKPARRVAEYRENHIRKH